MFSLPTSLTNLGTVVVYHIVKSEDKNNLDLGYVGVTTNFAKRKIDHFEALNFDKHRNKKLQKYYREFSESIIMYVYKSFPKNEEDAAYQLEEFLRPKSNIGLNIAVGGSKKYEEIFNAKEYSTSSYDNSKSDNFFSAIKKGLKNLDKKLETFADEALTKTELDKKRQPKELEQWEKEQNAKLEQRIHNHLNRPKLDPKDQEAVDLWLKKNK